MPKKGLHVEMVEGYKGPILTFRLEWEGPDYNPLFDEILSLREGWHEREKQFYERKYGTYKSIWARFLESIGIRTRGNP